jgi:hypothetical protein
MLRVVTTLLTFVLLTACATHATAPTVPEHADRGIQNSDRM